MAEIIVNSGIEEAYAQLKMLLTQTKCKIVAEEAPKSVSAIQGSLWGTSPKTAQKKTTYTLKQEASGTHITGTSTLTSSYINLTLVGVALSVALMLVCAWIASDLQGYAANGMGFWGWLAWTNGQFSHFDPDKATVFIRLTSILAAFLAGTLIVEAIIVAKIRAKIDVFAEETLRALQN